MAQVKEVLTGEGQVFKMAVQVGNKDEVLHYGDLTGILKSRLAVDLLWIDATGDNPIADDVIGVINQTANQSQGVRLVFVADPRCMEKIQVVITKLMDATSVLAAYKDKQLMMYFPKDDSMGQRQQYSSAVCRKVIMLSPSHMKNSLPYMVSHIGWTPAVVTHVVGLLDLLTTVFT